MRNEDGESDQRCCVLESTRHGFTGMWMRLKWGIGDVRGNADVCGKGRWVNVELKNMRW